MSIISDLAKSVVSSMETKNTEKITQATEQTISQVKETIVKEVIRDNLNVDVSQLATKSEVVENKYDDTDIKETLNNKINKNDVYTKDEIIDLLAQKANFNDVYRKIDTYSQDKIQELLDLEANKDSVYTIAQVDELLNNKADKNEIPNVEGLATETYVNEHQYDDTEIKNVIAQKANKSEIPDVSNLATQSSVDSLNDKVDNLQIPSIEGLATEAYVNEHQYNDTEIKNTLAQKADKTEIPNISNLVTNDTLQTSLDTKINKNDVFKNDVFYVKQSDTDGSYNLFWQEKNSGGGNQYFNANTNTLSYVGVNKHSDADKVAVQIYTKNKTTNIGTRLSFHPELGIFYSKNSLGGNANNFAPGREIAVKDDISALVARIEELEAKVNALS